MWLERFSVIIQFAKFYDRGKLYEILFDARNHKLRGITFGDLGALCAFGIDSYTINLLLIPLPL
jgi:hypothetical protein